MVCINIGSEWSGALLQKKRKDIEKMKNNKRNECKLLHEWLNELTSCFVLENIVDEWERNEMEKVEANARIFDREEKINWTKR